MKNFFIAIALIVFALVACQQKMARTGWKEATAKIVSADLRERTDRDTRKTLDGQPRKVYEKEYFLVIKYAYSVDGSGYTGTFETRDHDSPQAAMRLAKKVPTGKDLPIRYDPENPQNSEASHPDRDSSTMTIALWR